LLISIKRPVVTKLGGPGLSHLPCKLQYTDGWYTGAGDCHDITVHASIVVDTQYALGEINGVRDTGYGIGNQLGLPLLMEVQLVVVVVVVQERVAHHRHQEEEGMQAVQMGAAVQQEVVEEDLHQEQFL